METPEVPEFLHTFALWHDSKRYDLPGELFSRLSKRGARSMKQGESYGFISTRARDEAVESFISACKLEPYKVRPSIAFELLSLSEEWEVPTLQRFISDYIQSKALDTRLRADPLGTLLLHLEMGVSDPADLYQVAEIVNDILQDDRLLLVPPELIFKIILAADTKTLDQQLLIDFTLALLYENPSAAVPLTLLLDFGRLDEDQTEAVFLTREMHRMNLNFFTAWALSYGRNKAETELLQFRLRELNEIAMMKDLLNRGQDDQVLQAESRHRDEFGRLQRIAVDQQLELDRLMEEITTQEKEQEQTETEHRRRISGMIAKIEEMSKNRTECSAATDGEDEHIRGEVREQIDKLHAEFSANLGEVLDHAAKHLNRVKGEEKSGMDPVVDGVRDMEAKFTAYEKTIGSLNDSIQEGKGVLAVKMLRDQLRFDKYVRTTKEKLRVFKKGEPIWNIDGRQAKMANKLLSDLQKSIEDVCPEKDGDVLIDESM
jgi:hypothetical protein